MHTGRVRGVCVKGCMARKNKPTTRNNSTKPFIKLGIVYPFETNTQWHPEL